MPALSALSAIGTGLGQGAAAIREDQQAAARLALNQLALQQGQQQLRQQQLQDQVRASLWPGIMSAYGGQQPQGQQGPPPGGIGTGFAPPGPPGPQMPQMPPGMPGTGLAPPMPQQMPQMPPPPQMPAGQYSAASPAQQVGADVAQVPSLDRISMAESGNRNVPNQQGPGGTPLSSAGGYWQITDPTWRDAAPKAGVDLKLYPTALQAPEPVQRQVADYLRRTRGIQPWATRSGALHGAFAPGAGLTGEGQAAARSMAAQMPPEVLGQARQAAGQAAQQFDPMEYGRLQMQRVVQTIDKQDIPPEAKAMAAIEMSKLLLPEDRMSMSMMLRQMQLAQGEQRIEASQDKSAGQPLFDPKSGKWYQPTAGGGVRTLDLPATAQKPSTTGGQWSEDSMAVLVDRALATGEQGVLSQLPRSGPARQQFEETLAKRLKEMPGGIEGGVANMVMNNMRMAEAKSAAATAGRVTMNTQLYSAEAEGAAKLVVDASKKVPRTNLPTINAIEEAGLKHTGDPNIIQLGLSIVSLLNAYGKMSNPTGTGIHDADKARLESQLSAALSQGQIEAGVEQIVKEGVNLSQAAQVAQHEVLKTILPVGAGGSGAPAAAAPAAAGAAKYTVGQVIDAKGKKYRVTGGDLANDPDVEEVK